MNNKSTKSKPASKRKFNRILAMAAVAMLVVIAAGYYLRGKIESPASSRAVQLTSHVVTRGDLVISVAESGDIKAIDSTDIMSKVEGRTSLISIVDEGSIITEEDVKNGKIIAELDSSQIRESLAQQEVTFSNADADYEDAKESLAIQIKQNESDIQAGEMSLLFALMDFKKYLGEELADTVIIDHNDMPTEIDTASLFADERLNGEALQRLKELKNNISLTESELSRAKKMLEGTERLYEKKYVAEFDLIADRLDVQSLEAKLENAKIALELFELYEFPKQAQQLLSNYHEAMRELDRIQARSRSRLAQEQARLRNKEATYNLQKERLDKYRAQYEACTIKAPVTGQVVYGSSLLDARQRSRELIEVGAEIRERQRIISIPDTSQMKVEIKVHETWIGKIEPGQAAIISISAFPDRTFNGTVLRKAPLADPQNWRSPDLKVYTTDVAIEGNHDFIKTGMSARVEVIISRLKNVLTVPIQSVVTIEGKKYCYLQNHSDPVKQQVEIGQFNANFVEIRSGLNEGDRVLLNPPRVTRTHTGQPATEPQTDVNAPDESDRGSQSPSYRQGGDESDQPQDSERRFQRPDNQQQGTGSDRGNFQRPTDSNAPQGTERRRNRPQGSGRRRGSQGDQSQGAGSGRTEGETSQ